MIEITVKGDKKDYTAKLRDPGFEELSTALSAMTMQDGRINFSKAGKFLIDACWMEGDNEIINDPKLLFSASLKVGRLVDAFEVDLKKK